MVCIIILNWNGISVTLDCINSLLKVSYQNFKIVLVDNGSVDGSVDILQEKFKNHPMVSILPLEKNIGFTGGNNTGIMFAKKEYNPDYYLLLNNDTVVEPSFLQNMLDSFIDDSNIYAVVPKIFFYDNPKLLWFAGGSISKWTGVATHFGEGKHDNTMYNTRKEIQFMNGCCALISSETLEEIGLLDDIFFANSEDVDYSLRILKAKKKIVYAPSAVIYHKVNYSFKANKGKWLAFYLATRNIILLQKKHLNNIRLPIFFILFSVRWILYLTLKLSLIGDFLSIKALYKGSLDGLFNKLSYVNK